MSGNEKDHRPLPHPRQKTKIEGEKPVHVQATEEKTLRTKGAEFRAEKENVIIRPVIIGILPCVEITSLRQDA